MDQRTADRLAENERRFRDINERLADDLRELTAPGERVAFVCECSDPSCRETIELDLEAYSAVRSVATHFAIVEGHDSPEIERVVERRDRYSVVEKLYPDKAV